MPGRGRNEANVVVPLGYRQHGCRTVSLVASNRRQAMGDRPFQVGRQMNGVLSVPELADALHEALESFGWAAGLFEVRNDRHEELARRRLDPPKRSEGVG